MKKSKAVKIVGTLFASAAITAVMTMGAAAQQSTASVNETNSLDLHLGSGYCSAESIYHVGSGRPYDDADVTSKVGCTGLCRLKVNQKLHTPGTNHDKDKSFIYVGKKNAIDGVFKNDCVTPGSDTGIGYCESVRYDNSDKNYTKIKYRTYISMYLRQLHERLHFYNPILLSKTRKLDLIFPCFHESAAFIPFEELFEWPDFCLCCGAGQGRLQKAAPLSLRFLWPCRLLPRRHTYSFIPPLLKAGRIMSARMRA